MIGAGSESAAPKPKSETDIKALYVYNFAKYTTGTNWPSDSADSFVVGVAGQDDLMFRSLQQMLESLQIKGRPIKVERFDPKKERHYQVLFFAAKEKQWQQMLATLRTEGVLTVGDQIEGFSERGMIELVTDKGRGKIEFTINVEAGQAAGLAFDTRLLRMAREVKMPRVSATGDDKHRDGG